MVVVAGARAPRAHPGIAVNTLTFEPGGALRSRLVASMLADDPALLQPGSRVGPFRVLRRLGHGGLGVVYLAERADGAFEQEVALKVIAPQAEPATAEALLVRERKLLARLIHPNIARLLDGGSSESGLLWFAMERVEGERIDHYCRRAELDARQRVALFEVVCSAVVHAHARLVVHRDIKPSNILVDVTGAPKLLDFGIAAALDEAIDTPARTAATPAYASPEQVRGEPAGVLQDVYQLGRLLETVLGATRPDADLAAICRRAVADQPEARYPTVESLRADVRAYLARRPVSARAGGVAYRVGRLIRRRRAAVVGITAAAALVCAMVVAFLWRLEHARVRAEREATTARHVSGFLASLFEQADPAANHGRKPDAGELLSMGAERIGVELQSEPEVMGELLTTLGVVYLKLDDNHHAAPLLERAVAVAEETGAPALQFARRCWLLAMAIGQTEGQRADVLLARASALVEKDAARAGSESAGLYNRILHAQATRDGARGDTDGKLRRLRKAVDHARSALPVGDPATTVDILTLGQELLDTSHHQDAMPLLSEALALAKEHQGIRHPYTLKAQAIMASALDHDGQHAAAIELMDEALAATGDLYGEQSSPYAVLLIQKGSIAIHREAYDAAVPVLRRALEINEALPPENDVSSVDALEMLGDVAMTRGDLTSAETWYRRMLARNDGGRHAQVADTGQRTLKLAMTLAKSGRCEEAATVLQSRRLHTAPPSCDELSRK